MTIANMSDPNTMTGATVTGGDGEKLGKVDAIYFDNDTDKPEWAAVKSGLFGSHVSLVPLAQGTWNNGTLTVPFDKHALQTAPHHNPDASITPTDDAMTRSEEQLRVGTQTRETGRARLRKHVVTEYQQVTVPVSHEEVTLTREPITDANRGNAYDGPAISEEEHEVTLHAERPVVDTETVAVERVRLGKQTVTEQETVSGEIRKEQIELDDSDVVDTTNTVGRARNGN